MNNNELLNKVIKATLPNKSEDELDNIDKLVRYVVNNVINYNLKQQEPTICPTNLREEDSSERNRKLKRR